MKLELALDCRHYRGDRPCEFGCRCRCAHYQPMGKRILIIKLAALGDVVRTTCLLPTLKRVFRRCHITWISEPAGVRILRGHPMIDRLLEFDAKGIVQACGQEFDLVLSLDKEPAPASLCNQVFCADKRGMALSRWGTVGPINDECLPYFELGLDDRIKFRRNTRSYPQLIHEAVGLPYQRRPYRLPCDGPALARARLMRGGWGNGGRRPLVGVNTGSGSGFANKAPRRAQWVEICRALHHRGCDTVLLGGRGEAADNAWIQQQLGGLAYWSGSNNTEQEFVAIVSQCDALICGDTLAMHIAVARDVPAVVLFGPTCPQEIDLFDRGLKIVSPIACSPCYRRKCDKTPNCMDGIPVRKIVAAVDKVLGPRRGRRSAHT